VPESNSDDDDRVQGRIRMYNLLPLGALAQ
jgi:hypothetical protein